MALYIICWLPGAFGLYEPLSIFNSGSKNKPVDCDGPGASVSNRRSPLTPHNQG
jgi:hypothetical protein